MTLQMYCSIHFIEMSKKFQNHKGRYFEHNQTLILSKISKKVYDNLYKSIIFSHAMIELDNIKSIKKNQCKTISLCKKYILYDLISHLAIINFKCKKNNPVTNNNLKKKNSSTFKRFCADKL